MSKRVITFLAESNGVTTRLMYEVSDSCTWGAQAYMFEKFLLAQGYVLSDGVTGANVSDYVNALEEAEEDYGF